LREKDNNINEKNEEPQIQFEFEESKLGEGLRNNVHYASISSKIEFFLIFNLDAMDFVEPESFQS
jgi:hypothetical protein